MTSKHKPITITLAVSERQARLILDGLYVAIDDEQRRKRGALITEDAEAQRYCNERIAELREAYSELKNQIRKKCYADVLRRSGG